MTVRAHVYFSSRTPAPFAHVTDGQANIELGDCTLHYTNPTRIRRDATKLLEAADELAQQLADGEVF
jgi:hypothetical protein